MGKSANGPDPRRAQKREGRNAAKQWAKSARPPDIVRVAGYDFEYEVDTLDDLENEGLPVPHSSDFVFSFGFWKWTKGRVNSLVRAWQQRVEEREAKL